MLVSIVELHFVDVFLDVLMVLGYRAAGLPVLLATPFKFYQGVIIEILEKQLREVTGKARGGLQLILGGAVLERGLPGHGFVHVIGKAGLASGLARGGPFGMEDGIQILGGEFLTGMDGGHFQFLKGFLLFGQLDIYQCRAGMVDNTLVLLVPLLFRHIYISTDGPPDGSAEDNEKYNWLVFFRALVGRVLVSELCHFVPPVFEALTIRDYTAIENQVQLKMRCKES